MNSNERAVIEELKSSLEGKLQRSLVDAYLKKPDADGIISQVVAFLEKAITKNETQ